MTIHSALSNALEATHDLPDADMRASYIIESLTQAGYAIRPVADLGPDELAAVPPQTVIRSAAGTIAARYDNDRGVLFGDDRPIQWTSLEAPATILWHPSWTS